MYSIKVTRQLECIATSHQFYLYFISQKKPLDCHNGPIHYVYNETFQPNLTTSSKSYCFKRFFKKKSEMKQVKQNSKINDL